MYIVPDSDYTISATAKTITLTSTYNGLSAGQIQRIVDITSGEILYDADAPEHKYIPVAVSGLVITYVYGNNVKNTDKLRIALNSTYLGIDGGSA